MGRKQPTSLHCYEKYFHYFEKYFIWFQKYFLCFENFFLPFQIFSLLWEIFSLYIACRSPFWDCLDLTFVPHSLFSYAWYMAYHGILYTILSPYMPQMSSWETKFNILFCWQVYNMVHFKLSYLLERINHKNYLMWVDLRQNIYRSSARLNCWLWFW